MARGRSLPAFIRWSAALRSSCTLACRCTTVAVLYISFPAYSATMDAESAMDGPIPGAPVGAGGESAVPLPPDRKKARAFREASCPREMREIVIKNFGEHPNPADPTRMSLTAQCDELMRALHPILTGEYGLLGPIEIDIDSRDLRYRVRVSNPYNASRLVKRLNGLELGKADEQWAPQLRRVYTEEKWDALMDSLGNQKLKAAIVKKPKLTASQMGDRRFARFGISVYLYFYALKRLARLMCIMAALALPVALLNLWNNRAEKPGCFDDEFPLAPLACAAFVSAGNVPTIGRYNDSLPIGEFVSHYDRHMLFSLLDVTYTWYVLITTALSIYFPDRRLVVLAVCFCSGCASSVQLSEESWRPAMTTSQRHQTTPYKYRACLKV